MNRLPVISGKEAVKRFEKVGYQFVRQVGSHMRLKHPSDPSRAPLSVPDHKTVRKGLLRRLLRDANISIDEFTALG